MAIGLPIGYKRLSNNPMDDDCVYNDYDEAVAYAAGATSYPGQIIAVKKEDTWKLYIVQDDKTLLEVKGSGESGSAVLEKDIVVTGVTVGNVTDGTVISEGKDIQQILEQILMKRIAATYTQPSISISASGTNFEVGETPNITITPTWSKNDAGELVKYELTFDGAKVVDETATKVYTQDAVEMIANKTVNAVAKYSEGEIKNDNMGDPSPDGHILAGTKYANITLTVYRKLFAGSSADDSVAPADSAAVRALTQTMNSPRKGTNLSIVTQAGTKKVVFAYPASIGEVSTVKYVENSNMEVKDTFVKSVVQVAGANDKEPIDYNVYTYAPAIPTIGQMTFDVTI